MDTLRLKEFSATPVMQDVRSILGAMLHADWLAALVARGYGWHFDAGAFSTPIVGGGNGTVFDQDQPEFCISAPAGWTIIPIRLHVATQTPLLATDADETEILLAVDRLAKYAGDGTVVSETPTNMRTDITSACPLTCFSAGTGNITNPTLGIELAHAVKTGDVQGTPATALWTDLALLYEPLRPPFIVGPAAIYGYWGGTVATTGFANLDFLAVPSALLSGQV